MRLFNHDDPKEETIALRTLVQGNTRFALNLYRHIRTAEGNLFFSPYSISTALAMTYGGARGDTESQMRQALSIELDTTDQHRVFALLADRLEDAGANGDVQLKIANALWPREGLALLKEYLKLAKKYYGVKIKPVDFGNEEAAREEINQWVEEKTEEKIKDLIAAGVLDAQTRMVLVNAIYFKGDWRKPFDPNLTHDEPFWTSTGESVQVGMMTRKGMVKFAEDQELQVLELLYQGEDVSMVVLLPREIDGLKKIEESLNEERLAKWTSELRETEVEAFLPKFELSYPLRLDETLKSMGMVDAFSTEADFSGMEESRELFIGAVLHKAFVRVDEKGTEAAAATAVMMQTKAIHLDTVIFRADHPFIFMIRERSTGTILFLGRVMKPV